MPLSKSVLTAVFRRSGSTGEHTTLYEDATASTKQFVEAALRQAGVSAEPVLVTVFSLDDWSVITTRGLVVGREGQAKLISADDVCKVEPVWHEGQFRKTDLNTLEVYLRGGTTLRMRTDPGSTFSGLWNVLKTFETRSAKATDIT